MNKNKLTRIVRIVILVGLLAYVTYEAYMHQLLGGGKAASVHALCPLGALESLYALLFMGTFLQKIYSGTVVLLVLTVVLAILFRRSFCGLLCPFGALQELFTLIRKKLNIRRFTIPQSIDRPLRYLKYFILLLTVGMSWYLGTLWISPYDPYSAYAHITAISSSIEEDPLAIIGFIILALSIIGSFLYDRFFCKYLCPVGALYGLIGKISPTKVVRKDEACTHCKLCNKACPVNLEIEKLDKVNSAECINCNECVLACPKKGALEVRTAGRKVHPAVILAAVVGLFFGSIFVAQATGNFEILPEALKNGETITISEVKGYYTIDESAAATGLTLQEVYEKLGIPESVPKTTQLKNISGLVDGFDLDAAKEKAETNSPADVTETTEAESAGTVDVDLVKGRMTIEEAADTLKMEQKEFYKLFKIPDNVPAQTRMKDIVNVSKGYDFEEIKESLK